MFLSRLRGYFCMFALSTIPCFNWASDVDAKTKSEAEIKLMPHETMAGDWITRIRALYFLPNNSSSLVGSIPHSGMHTHPCWSADFDITYMFYKNLGLELMLTTCKNSLVGSKVLEGIDIGTVFLFPLYFNSAMAFFP